MQQLIAQTTPSRKIDEFLKQKADGFDIAYDNKDVKTYNSLLSEYLVLHENLPTNEKKERSYELSNIYYNLSCIYSLLDNKISAINSLKNAIDAGYNNYGHVQLDTDLD
ncbi:MAG: TPR end-of-group domain-containing protein, partial [Bacteroidota bacterium]